MHQSNFFIDNEGNLGIFDLVSMFNWRIEYDFSVIYLNSLYNDNFLFKVLDNYKFKEYFNYKIMLKITLQKIVENIRYGRPIKNEWIYWLKKALIKLKHKLWNLT